MTRFLRRAAAAFALSLGFSVPAQATTFSPDFTDLWYNVAESGWGFNVIQQGNVIFGTLFVYGSDNKAEWYVADAMILEDGTSGNFRFTSKLYRTTGPYFVGAFNSANVAATEVGEARITFSSSTSGTLTYNVGPNVISKQITRQGFRSNNPAGGYFGGWSAVASACANASNNGPSFLVGNITATLTGSAVTFRIESSSTFSCTYTGTYSQTGRLGAVAGTWTCVNSGTTTNTGTFTLADVDVQVNGLMATYAAQDNFCTYTGGRFGGFRVVGG